MAKRKQANHPCLVSSESRARIFAKGPSPSLQWEMRCQAPELPFGSLMLNQIYAMLNGTTKLLKMMYFGQEEGLITVLPLQKDYLA